MLTPAYDSDEKYFHQKHKELDRREAEISKREIQLKVRELELREMALNLREERLKWREELIQRREAELGLMEGESHSPADTLGSSPFGTSKLASSYISRMFGQDISPSPVVKEL